MDHRPTDEAPDRLTACLGATRVRRHVQIHGGPHRSILFIRTPTHRLASTWTSQELHLGLPLVGIRGKGDIGCRVDRMRACVAIG